MRCPICLEDLTQVAMAPCCHAYCRPCIETWVSGSNEPKCPLCKGPACPLTNAPWLDSNSLEDSNLGSSSSSSNSANSSFTCNLGSFSFQDSIVDKNTAYKYSHLQAVVEKMRQKPPVTVEKVADNEHKTRFDQLIKDRTEKEEQLRAKLQALVEQYEFLIETEYQRYQQELTEEEVKLKQADAENEYVEYLIKIGSCLSKQTSRVLAVHFTPYIEKVEQYVESFMGMIVDGPGKWFNMPETPVCYVPSTKKLLVSDGNKLFYYQEPMSIPHTGTLVNGIKGFYIVEPTVIYAYSFELKLLVSLKPEYRCYFLTVSPEGYYLSVQVDEDSFYYAEHSIAIDYDQIWNTGQSVVVRRGNAIHSYSKGEQIIYRPDDSIELHQGKTVTITKGNVVTTVENHVYCPEGPEVRQDIIIYENQIPQIMTNVDQILGPQLGGVMTKLVFECVGSSKFMRLKQIKCPN